MEVTNEKTMTTLTVTKEQLRLIQDALDMYSRIGLGQMWVIKDHPTFVSLLEKKCGKDYEMYHEARKIADLQFMQGRDQLLLDSSLGLHGSFGIYNVNVDDSCRVAFDIVQVIRHEFWKSNPDRSDYCVMSSVHLTTKDSDKIKAEL